jgi:hypothetical protein
LARYLPNAICVNAAVGLEFRQVSFEGFGVACCIGEKRAAVRMVCLQGEKALQISRSLLLKMDIEWAEMAVLPGLLRALPTNCSIFLETHCPQLEAEKLLSPFRNERFDVRKLRHQEEPDEIATYMDWELARR